MAKTFTLKSNSYDERYMQLYCEQTQDIVSNKSDISWRLSSIGGDNNYYSTGPTTVVINGEQVYYKKRVSWDAKTFPAAKGSTSGTISVAHNSDGSKSISVSMTTDISDGKVDSYSGTWELDSIPRQATITAAPDFTDCDNPTITYSNPAGTAVSALEACISLTGEDADIAYRAISKSGSSYTFPLTEEERNVLRDNTPGPDRTVWFIIRTKIGSSNYWSSLQKKLSIEESDATKPMVSMDISVNNGSLPSIFDGLYIQGKSKVNVSLSAERKFEADITGYSAMVDGKAYNSDNIISDVIQSSGDVQITGYAKDSRGFTGIAEQTVNVIPYAKPMVVPLNGENAILCYRSDGNGKRVGNSTSLWIKAKRFFYDVSNKNLCALQWRWKGVAEVWSDSAHPWLDLLSKTDTTTDEYNALVPGVVFDLKKAYIIQILAVDDIGEFDIKTFEIPTQDVAIHLGRGGKNVSVGTYCDYSEDHTFYSVWKAIFDKDVVVGGDVLIGPNKTSLKDYILSVVNEGG